MSRARYRLPVRALLPTMMLMLLVALFGCSKVDPSADRSGGIAADRLLSASDRALGASPAISQLDPGPPADLRTVTAGPHSLTLWPYTGRSFDGEPSDPMHLVFWGDADPLRIRSALMALDGDRTSLGLPPIPPFNERWEDAMGDVQTGYSDGGWSGSVVQLRLGQYEPLRVHLRLFQTGVAYGAGGTWTLGAAHFELLIPGTPEHEVLSWELARAIVLADLERAGIVAAPPVPSDPLIPGTTFRAINPFIYNALGDDLRMLVFGLTPPPVPATAPVPMPIDPRATIVRLGGTPDPAPGSWSQALTLPFAQMIPKPLCSDGPYDYVYVEGPVSLSRRSVVDGAGGYSYTSRVTGRLTITPMDVTQDPPVPAGEPYEAVIEDSQGGRLGFGLSLANARTKRIAPQDGGSELELTNLRVSSSGSNAYQRMTRCLEP